MDPDETTAAADAAEEQAQGLSDQELESAAGGTLNLMAVNEVRFN